MAYPSVKTTAGRGWNIGLWIAQLLLFLAFLAAGQMKLFTPIDELSAVLPYAAEMPGLVRFIGLSEILGAVGVVLPALTRILPKLTILAATSLLVVMVLAIGFHLSRGEFMIVPNLVLGGLAGLVAWGRSRIAVIPAR